MAELKPLPATRTSLMFKKRLAEVQKTSNTFAETQKTHMSSGNDANQNNSVARNPKLQRVANHAEVRRQLRNRNAAFAMFGCWRLILWCCQIGKCPAASRLPRPTRIVALKTTTETDDPMLLRQAKKKRVVCEFASMKAMAGQTFCTEQELLLGGHRRNILCPTVPRCH